MKTLYLVLALLALPIASEAQLMELTCTPDQLSRDACPTASFHGPVGAIAPKPPKIKVPELQCSADQKSRDLCPMTGFRGPVGAIAPGVYQGWVL